MSTMTVSCRLTKLYNIGTGSSSHVTTVSFGSEENAQAAYDDLKKDGVNMIGGIWSTYLLTVTSVADGGRFGIVFPNKELAINYYKALGPTVKQKPKLTLVKKEPKK